ncbi:MAG: SET domain-containing protein-lysine N-methyltransferase [Helicobacteraceae bacterium]|nr:SET domain-containing protein-lysine N-methyltransferase [Helicobacteraceae bacterium]
MNNIKDEISNNDCAQICVSQIDGKGRGVLAMTKIKNESVVEVAPLLLVPRDELLGTMLREYCFSYKRDRSLSAIALGYASLYNHAFEPNAKYSIKKNSVVITACRDIEKGEEICIDYNWSPRKCYSKGLITKEEFELMSED